MSKDLLQLIQQALSEECGHRERMETGNDTGALAHRMARLVYEKIKSDVEQTIKFCSVCLETDRKNSEIAHQLLSALGLTPRDISYADPMIKVIDTIQQLRQGVLTAALPGIERDFAWATEQLKAGKCISHPMLDGGSIKPYAKKADGTWVYQVTIGCLLWTCEGWVDKVAALDKMATMTYGWEATDIGWPVP